MSSVDSEIFWDWAVSKFGEDNCIQHGDEICINSPFVPDRGHHLWCNCEKAVFHCWKSGEAGTLYDLVIDQEGCDWSEAYGILGGDRILHKLEEKVAELFSQRKEKPITKTLLVLPTDTFRISELSAGNRLRLLAEKYLNARKIPVDGLYICGGGKYAMRIVIPYYGPEGQLIYFNCRDITNKAKLRYRGPDKSMGTGKGDVIWMKSWPPEGTTVYLTEGEFDAMSLCQANFVAGAAGGKNFSDKQLQLLKSYNMVICFDTDKYGLDALNKIGNFLRAKQFVRGKNDQIGYVRPAKGYKDWNEMLVHLGPAIIYHYIKMNEKMIDRNGLINLRLNQLM